LRSFRDAANERFAVAHVAGRNLGVCFGSGTRIGFGAGVRCNAGVNFGIGFWLGLGVGRFGVERTFSFGAGVEPCFDLALGGIRSFQFGFLFCFRRGLEV
jgi:hypothetical protein